MRTLLSLAAVVLVINGGGLHADDKEVGIIKKAVEAHGGEKNLAKFMKCEIKKEGTVAFGQTYPFTTILTAGTGKFEELVSLYTPSMLGVKPTLFMSVRNTYTGEKGQFVVDSLVLKEDRLADKNELRE